MPEWEHIDSERKPVRRAVHELQTELHIGAEILVAPQWQVLHSATAGGIQLDASRSLCMSRADSEDRNPRLSRLDERRRRR